MRVPIACVCPMALFVLFASTGCTGFIPRTGGITWHTNHTSVEGFGELETPPAFTAQATVEHVDKWAHRPFSIANTADTAREIRMTLRATEPVVGDATRETIELIYRASDPIGIPNDPYTIDELARGDRVTIGYDLDALGKPTHLAVIITRETLFENSERARQRFLEEYNRSQAD